MEAAKVTLGLCISFAVLPCIAWSETILSPSLDTEYNQTGGCVAEMFLMAGMSPSDALAYEQTLISHSVSITHLTNPTDAFLRLLGVSSPEHRQSFIRCFSPTHAASRPAQCSTHRVCNGHGRCNLTAPLGYTCACNEGFYGPFCDFQVDHCHPRPCGIGGVCQNSLTGYTCQCKVGYRGSKCQEKWLTYGLFNKVLKRQRAVEKMLEKVLEQNARILANQQQATTPQPSQSVRYEIYTQHATWPVAVRRCQEYGGQLASVRSQEQQDLITALPNMSLQVNSHLWLGASDAGHEGRWTWVNGDDITYENWYSNSAIHGHRGENCLSLVQLRPTGVNNGSQSTFVWDDMTCLHSFNYVCEFTD